MFAGAGRRVEAPRQLRKVRGPSPACRWCHRWEQGSALPLLPAPGLGGCCPHPTEPRDGEDGFGGIPLGSSLPPGLQPAAALGTRVRLSF